MLTQDILCHADADLITYRWMDTQQYPQPDKHKVDADRYLAMQKPEANITQIPGEPGYYASKRPFQICR